MTSRRDYFLMAGVFREVYLKQNRTPYQTPDDLFMALLSKFMNMLAKDNARFNRTYFMNFIKEGSCK